MRINRLRGRRTLVERQGAAVMPRFLLDFTKLLPDGLEILAPDPPHCRARQHDREPKLPVFYLHRNLRLNVSQSFDPSSLAAHLNISSFVSL